MEEKESKKRTEIFELPDGEFLSFLYSERDRENSLRQYQGWNIWALVGAIATVVVAGYFILKEHLSSISFAQVLMLLSTAFSYLLCFGFVSIIFNKERGIDYQKVKFLKDIAPHCYLWCSFLLSVTLSICIIVVNKDNSWNYVSIGWMFVSVVFLVGIISTFINKDKIVVSFIDEMVFPDIKWDRTFTRLVVYPMAIIGAFSIGYISFPIGTPEFELSVCIIILSLLVYLLIKVIISEHQANKIDVLIDDYVYKGDSKESTYRMMRIYKMGHTVVESCAKEMIGIGTSLEMVEKEKQKLDGVAKLFKENRVNWYELEEYSCEMKEAQALLHKYFKHSKNLKDKLSQVLKQVPKMGDNDDYMNLVTINNVSILKIEELIDALNTTAEEMSQWIEKYRCMKYGGLCAVDCKQRYEKPLLCLRIKRFFRIRTKMVHKCNYTE